MLWAEPQGIWWICLSPQGTGGGKGEVSKTATVTKGARVTGAMKEEGKGPGGTHWKVV